jgi:hypothetical protein
MYSIKQGDTRHALKTTLQKSDGSPLDVTGLNVYFNFKDALGVRYRRAADITDAVNGIVSLVFEDGDTDAEGLLHAEVEVIHADGRKETFPNDGYITVHILPTLKGV